MIVVTIVDRSNQELVFIDVEMKKPSGRLTINQVKILVKKNLKGIKK